MNGSALLDAALDYAGRDHIPVFPCIERGKEPAVARGFHAATTNPETIRRLWRQPRNIGIPTGPLAGFWVLDIDGTTGEASLRTIEAQHGPLPATRTVLTGNGRHVWFKYTGPVPSTAGRIAPGIDTRGEGGYVIGPPSVHPTGRTYTWMDSAHEIALAPSWLVDLVRRKPQPTILERAQQTIRRNRQRGAYGAAALNNECATLATTAPGARNNALNRATFSLFQLVAGGELDRDEVIERLVHACHANGLVRDDGLRSVLATIRRGSHAGSQQPRGAP